MKIKKILSSIEDFSDEECMEIFLALLAERVIINTGFLKDEESDNLVHQILQVHCGDLVSVSEPEVLAVPLRPATGQELGETVN